MPQYLDIYFLLDDRNIEKVKEFIHRYSPTYEECAMDYPVPIYSNNPKDIFNNIFDLFDYLEKNENCNYLVYLRNLDDSSNIKYVIIQFTNDGKIIIGVSLAGSNPAGLETSILFYKLKRSLIADVGYITVEEPPPVNSFDFLGFSQNRYIPNLTQEREAE